MKLLVVTTWLPTPRAPESGIFVERDIDLLAQDHDVHVVHLSASARSDDGSGAASDRRWTLDSLPMSPANPLSVAAAARELRGMLADYELVHSMAASALLPFRRLDVPRPWVHTEHWSGLLAPETVPLHARLGVPTTMRLLRRPDVVVAVGSQLARKIRSVRQKPVVVVPNAVTVPDALVERRDDDVLRLVGVGGLVPRKGPDVAVGALAELVARGRDTQLTWVGDGAMRAEVEALAQHLGVADRVRLRGRVAPADVSAALAEADVFLLPTTRETFGVAIAEALASGRPVVVGARGEQAEFVHEPDGVLVGEQAPTAYADAVERVVAANADRTAEQIARSVTERFTEQRRRAAYAEVYADAERIAGARD
ncbi:glycosyltransferase family 4 protein [Agromyces sp. SYSU K20354]|uniref:glycosyltransferase family 4 protein n=1 Tax=Agromyces cavernae TaxID=2898659 RepID=UPI001E4EEAC1|nr:glycosyltransferase family 4 protein [Agromyces cavernae]MCD2444061.1 glycosyltransferase family 4 protein [Agromyces cavernae]